MPPVTTPGPQSPPSPFPGWTGPAGETRLGTILFAIALVVHLWCAHLGWNNVPVDGHEFRQTQTAISARYLAQDGLRIDYPTPLLGKPWSIPLEFPLYQNAVALLVRTTGMSVPPAGRAVGLLFFYLTLPAVYLLAGRLAQPPGRRLLILAAVLTSPLFLFYPRTVMMETTALCLSAWFLWAYWRAVAGGSWGATALALGCGAMAAMVKLPTLGVFLPPAVFILIWELRRPAAASHTSGRKVIIALAVMGLSVGAGLAWTAHADAVKALNPLASFLNSSAVGVWGMGALNLRFSGDFWSGIFTTIAQSILGYPGLLVLLLFCGLSSRAVRRVIWILLACFSTGPLVFSHLYQLHDYYYIASGIFLLGAFGLALGCVLDLSGWPRTARWIVVTGLLSLGVITYARTYYRLIPNNESRIPQLGRALNAATKPDDILVIFGQDWNPVLPYTADRRALMIPPGIEDNLAAQADALARLGDDRVGALVVTGRIREYQALLQPVIKRYGLSAKPVLTGKTTDVYLREADTTAIVPVLLGLGLSEYQIDSRGLPIEVARLGEEARKLFAMMKPAPRAVAAQFGLGLLTLDDGVVFGAHPVTQLVFTAPPGARRLRAGFGILPGAYADPLKSTDGVLFTVRLRQTDGTTSVLAERLLQPVTQEKDRGAQTFDLALPAGLSGDIIMLTGPGPAGNFSFDWAYWSSVEIE